MHIAECDMTYMLIISKDDDRDDSGAYSVVENWAYSEGEDRAYREGISNRPRTRRLGEILHSTRRF